MSRKEELDEGRKEESRGYGWSAKEKEKADENGGQVIILSTTFPCGLIR